MHNPNPQDALAAHVVFTAAGFKGSHIGAIKRTFRGTRHKYSKQPKLGDRQLFLVIELVMCDNHRND